MCPARPFSIPIMQVIWVDLLTEREFNAGFGSHTPMFTGQVGLFVSFVYV